MTLSITDDQLDLIAQSIHFLDDSYDKPIDNALEELGLDANLINKPALIEKLHETMFVCDQCNKWNQLEVRVYNNFLGMKCCEECDENNPDD